MQDIADKADSTAGSTGQLPAAEYNDHKEELQGAVERSGQTLSAAILLQLAKALFINGTGAETVIDSGSINSILLSPLTGSSGMVVPNNYVELNGCILSFNKTTGNTSTAVTVNFGQTGTELGAKSLVRSDSSVPAIGDVKGRCLIQWNNSLDKWILLRNETDTYKYNIAASGPVAPKFANNEIEVDLSAGNISISQMPVPVFIGQRVHIYGVGTGLGDIAGGTGLYVNGIVFTETTGGVFLTAISLTEWRAKDTKTAFFNTPGWSISQYPDGVLEMIFRSGSFQTVNALGNVFVSGVINALFPVAFINNPRKLSGVQSTGDVAWEGAAGQPTLLSDTLRILGGGTSAVGIIDVKYVGSF